MKNVLLFWGCFFTVHISIAQSLAVSNIPKELLYHAGAVIRNEELIEEVISDNKMEVTYRETVTVLNKSGEEEAEITAWYDKLSKIKSIKGTIYNEFGVPVGKIQEKNFRDYSVADGFSLFRDDRAKTFVPAMTTYPYTVEYEVVTLSSQTMWFPVWRPASSAGVAVEHATYTVITPAGFKVRYKQYNYNDNVQTSRDEKDNNKYKWAITNKKAVRHEPYCYNKSLYATSVTVVPNKFYYDGVSGEYTNWTELGNWMNDKLLSGRGKLSEETKTKILELTKGITDPKEKAKIIYEYMQQKTRYISIQVGIGGFRPMMVSDVDQLGYGDCKALSFYTKSLLDVAGIPSYYCVVYGDRYEKRNPTEDFPQMLFGNHIILCLPFTQDTTFLECTSQKIPFGFLGSFTDDRTVLACTPDGGKLLHTTCYKPEVNKQTRQASFVIDSMGTLTGTVNTLYEGLQFDNVEHYADLPYSEQVKEITKAYPVDNLTIRSLKYDKTRARIPSIKEAMQIEAANYGAISEKRMYMLPNVLNRKTHVPKEITNRTTPVELPHGYTDTDEITLTLPAGYKVEYMPESRTEECEFGKYTVSIKQDGDKLLLKRTTLYNQGVYPAEAYSKMVDFYSKIYETDNKKLVLVKE